MSFLIRVVPLQISYVSLLSEVVNAPVFQWHFDYPIWFPSCDAHGIALLCVSDDADIVRTAVLALFGTPVFYRSCVEFPIYRGNNAHRTFDRTRKARTCSGHGRFDYFHCC